jgi:hypothetical protein
MKNKLHMGYVSLFAFVAMSGASFAGDSNWTVVSTQEIKISKPEKIADFLVEGSTPEFESLRTIAVSRILAGLPVDKVISVSEVTQKLKWTGATKCIDNDPRLTVEVIGHTFNFASGHGAGSATAPLEQDPCTKN